MENMYPKYMAPMANLPPAAVGPTAVTPNVEPHVNVYNVNVKPAPAYAAPVAVHHIHPLMTPTGVILVLFILLVIVSRAPYFGGKC